MNWSPEQVASRGAKGRQGRVRNIAPVEQRIFRGVLYHSKAEKEYAQQLTLQVKAGAIHEWRRQVPYPIKVNGKKVCSLFVDFEVYHNDGSLEAIEVKGWESELYRLKAKLFAACYPKVKYTVVKVGRKTRGKSLTWKP